MKLPVLQSSISKIGERNIYTLDDKPITNKFITFHTEVSAILSFQNKKKCVFNSCKWKYANMCFAQDEIIFEMRLHLRCDHFLLLQDAALGN